MTIGVAPLGAAIARFGYRSRRFWCFRLGSRWWKTTQIRKIDAEFAANDEGVGNVAGPRWEALLIRVDDILQVGRYPDRRRQLRAIGELHHIFLTGMYP